MSRAVARDGVLCERIVNKLQQNEQAPAVRLEEWRNKFLLRTLKTATSKLAAYQDIKVNCDSGDVLDVLQNSFPVVSKEDLLSSPALFYPKGGKRYPWSIIGALPAQPAHRCTCFAAVARCCGRTPRKSVTGGGQDSLKECRGRL